MIISNRKIGFDEKSLVIVEIGINHEGSLTTTMKMVDHAKKSGAEVSGTIDESIRHSVSKLSHIHFVTNIDAKKRLLRMGEHRNSIKVIGSPEVDLFNSKDLPTISMVRERYEIIFDHYSILLFHPVITEVNDLKENVTTLIDSLIESKRTSR